MNQQQNILPSTTGDETATDTAKIIKQSEDLTVDKTEEQKNINYLIHRLKEIVEYLLHE